MRACVGARLTAHGSVSAQLSAMSVLREVRSGGWARTAKVDYKRLTAELAVLTIREVRLLSALVMPYLICHN